MHVEEIDEYLGDIKANNPKLTIFNNIEMNIVFSICIRYYKNTYR